MNSRTIAGLIAGLAALVATILLLDRGGLLAWALLSIGIALVAKIWLKPAQVDLKLALGLTAVLALAWVGTLYYVISTYESGEVVELAIDTNEGAHTARLWVLDIGADPTVYYDAEPHVAESLLAGKPLQFVRAGEVSTRTPKATPVDVLPEDEANMILEVMGTKYGSRMTAVDVYYLLLGRPRDRVALVANLVET